MSNENACSNKKCICNVIPPYILENIVTNGNEAQRATAMRTLGQDIRLRSERLVKSQNPSAAKKQRNGVDLHANATPHKKRLIHDAESWTMLPGKLVRSEGNASTSDIAVDEAYNGFGATFDLFWQIFKRDSIDNNGMDMSATVHYDYKYNNAFWDGKQMVFGDGDGYMFNRFTIAIDIMGHELAHGVTEHTAGLEYHDQPGALNESISDVFGSLVKQRALGQTADQADWLIGAGLLAASIKGVALRSMKAPGTAYDDWLIGKDPQPDHMSKYDKTTSDNGGVHINSGIPNKAFYLTAIGIGGFAWEKAGHIWYQTLVDPRLSATAQFQDFANITADIAGKLYGDSVQGIVVKAWRDVGITVIVPELPLVNFTVGNNRDGRLELFCIGTDKALYHNRQLSANSGTWSGWKSLGGKIRQINVSQNQDGRLQVFCVGAQDRLIHHRIQQTPGGDVWSDWGTLGEALQVPGTPGTVNKLEGVHAESDEAHPYSAQETTSDSHN